MKKKAAMKTIVRIFEDDSEVIAAFEKSIIHGELDWDAYDKKGMYYSQGRLMVHVRNIVLARKGMKHSMSLSKEQYYEGKKKSYEISKRSHKELLMKKDATSLSQLEASKNLLSYNKERLEDPNGYKNRAITHSVAIKSQFEYFNQVLRDIALHESLIGLPGYKTFMKEYIEAKKSLW